MHCISAMTELFGRVRGYAKDVTPATSPLSVTAPPVADPVKTIVAVEATEGVSIQEHENTELVAISVDNGPVVNWTHVDAQRVLGALAKYYNFELRER